MEHCNPALHVMVNSVKGSACIVKFRGTLTNCGEETRELKDKHFFIRQLKEKAFILCVYVYTLHFFSCFIFRKAAGVLRENPRTHGENMCEWVQS